MDIKKEVEEMRRNMIRLYINHKAEYVCGGTRFGGVPDVPEDFVWPTFETSTFDDDKVRLRPLSFLAQFNCAEISSLDKEGLLPRTGLLSFFYEIGSQLWGYDPKDAGCARVYWFEDIASLSKAKFPEDLDEDYRFAELQIKAAIEKSMPSFEDFAFGREDFYRGDGYEIFENICKELGHEMPENASKLLGWPDVIQNNMTLECELVSRGHYLGGGFDHIPKSDMDEARKTSMESWRLLFQLDTVGYKDFELMFGDCGRIYFYIRKEDLMARQFDKTWLILQCF
ncbi:YwqG family protein [Anaerotignum sp. MB30-C6]|uniref:YwqG family protein n=1 Tax=Anaerotignum sp. MB30-C6 TaxID=3070814 RepID=UPI0027DC3EC8|nr:YwqG family protein [Anaerotignum sp. MB30-C6]WMI80284.1 YwqG family protein [Anaerotignum sp. MB30-C6]